MGIVNILKFNRSCGAMICDEEATYFERRRTWIDQNIYPLVGDEFWNKHRLVGFYGGVGYPPFHYEVVNNVKKEICGKDITNVKKLAQVVLEGVKKAKRRRVNDKLKFHYGFNRDDFNRGFFYIGDEKYEIQQEKVKDKALAIIQGQDEIKPKGVFENAGVVAGYDPENGFSAYRLDGEITVLSFLTYFETIGSGKYGSALAFARAFNRMFLDEREEGFDTVEGLVLLLKSVILAREYFIDIGGYFTLVYINENLERGYKIFSPERVKLAEEIVLANLNSLLSEDNCEDLVNQALFEKASFKDVERSLFKRCNKPSLLEYLLMGYKLDPPFIRGEDEKREGIFYTLEEDVEKGGDGE